MGKGPSNDPRFCLRPPSQATTQLLPDFWLPVSLVQHVSFPSATNLPTSAGPFLGWLVPELPHLALRSLPKQNCGMNPVHREAPVLACLHLFQELSTLG